VAPGFYGSPCFGVNSASAAIFTAMGNDYLSSTGLFRETLAAAHGCCVERLAILRVNLADWRADVA
jgi:hypothetical protein